MDLFKNIFGQSKNENKAAKMDWTILKDLGQLNEIVDLSTLKPVVIFKHSTRCSVSRMALKQFESEFAIHDEVLLYFLDLLEHRDISNEIEKRFKVEHQSPQIIIVKDGKTIYHASHSDIQAEQLLDKL
jgi:bacillithiol system protein YtxJ